MLTGSERFAFVAKRIHAFATSGNAYDACQTDQAIETGQALIILSEGVVALAGAWPIAVTAEGGVLHSVIGKDDDTLDGLAANFQLTPDDILTAVTIARAFGFALDPVLSLIVHQPLIGRTSMCLERGIRVSDRVAVLTQSERTTIVTTLVQIQGQALAVVHISQALDCLDPDSPINQQGVRKLH